MCYPLVGVEDWLPQAIATTGEMDVLRKQVVLWNLASLETCIFHPYWTMVGEMVSFVNITRKWAILFPLIFVAVQLCFA